MKIIEGVVNALFRCLFRVFFRFDLDAFKKVPPAGPMILILNHPSIYEGPLLYVFLRQRNIVALAKKQLWERATVGWLVRLWRAIPVGQYGLDRAAMQQCFDILDSGDFLCIAPEGIRTNDGSLHQGKEGVAYIAFKKQVPILPIAAIGFERFSHYIKQLRRTPIQIIVGKPFEIIQKEGRLSPIIRQHIADEMMMRIAELMPHSYWGYYQDKPLGFRYTRQID